MLDPTTLAALNQLGITAEMVDTATSTVIWLTLVTVATAIPTAVIARRKGRSAAAWIVLALSIPLLPLLLVWWLPKKADVQGNVSRQ